MYLGYKDYGCSTFTGPPIKPPSSEHNPLPKPLPHESVYLHWTMPLSLPAMNASIVCNGRELETYDVKQEGISSLTGFIASEAGKVRVFFPQTDALWTTTEPIVSGLSNSKSQCQTIWLTLRSKLLYSLMGSGLKAMLCEPGRAGNSWGYIRAPTRSYHSSSRNFSLLVRLSFRCLSSSLLMCVERPRLGRRTSCSRNGDYRTQSLSLSNTTRHHRKVEKKLKMVWGFGTHLWA